MSPTSRLYSTSTSIFPSKRLCIMFFMYRHCQFCVSSMEKLSEPSSNTFSLFPLLPAEIRLKIWQIIANTPRTVELTCTPTSSHLPEGKWFSHSKSPAIFHICSESRVVAMSTYSALNFSPGQLGKPIKTPLQINFTADTLWLCEDLHPIWARDLLERNRQLRAKLMFLAVKERLWEDLNEIDLSTQPVPESSYSTGALGVNEGVLGGLKVVESIIFYK